MARKRLKLAIIFVGIVGFATVAYASYPVIDSAALAKLSEQIAAAKKQLEQLTEQSEFLNSISGSINEVNGSIGTLATITLPITSSENLASQLRSNLSCLMPSGLSWGINTDDLDFGSICSTTHKYRKAFFFNPEESKSDPGESKNLTFDDQDAKRREVQSRRENFLEDWTLRSIAAGDVHLAQAKETANAAQQLQEAAEQAKEIQERLAVSNKIQIALLRATAQQNQILAQMLKLHAAIALKAGLPADLVPSVDEGGEE